METDNNIESNQADSLRDLEIIQAKEFLSISEACTLLGISRSTLHRAIKQRTIPTTKLRGRTIIKREHIEKLFE